MSFFLYAAKCVHKTIVSKVIVFSEVDRVFHDIAIVVATFSVPLVEAASIVVSAPAVDLLAVVQEVVGALLRLVVLVQVITAVGAVLGAGDCRHTRASVHDQSLWLALGAQVDRRVKVLQVRGVAVQRRCLQVRMRHVSA